MPKLTTFYHAAHIDVILNCPRCAEKYVEPRIIVPCLNTLCKKCIDELSENQCQFECCFCKERHPLPEDGFQSNTTIELFLKLEPKEVNRNKKLIGELSQKLDDFTTLYKNFSENSKNLHSSLQDHKHLLKSQIDLISEQKIQQINEIREKMLKYVDDYADSCSSNIDDKTDEIENELKHFQAYIDGCNSFLQRFEIDDQEMKQQCLNNDSILKELKLALNNLEYVMFNGEKVDFISNTTDLDHELIGQFTHSKLETTSTTNNTRQIRRFLLAKQNKGSVVVKSKISNAATLNHNELKTDNVSESHQSPELMKLTYQQFGNSQYYQQQQQQQFTAPNRRYRRP